MVTVWLKRSRSRSFAAFGSRFKILACEDRACAEGKISSLDFFFSLHSSPAVFFRFSCREFSGSVPFFFLLFPRPPWLNRARSGMITLHRLVVKVVTDDVTSGRRDLDPHRRLRAIDLFTDTAAILNKFDLRSIIGCPGGRSTFRLYFRALSGTFFRKVFLE